MTAPNLRRWKTVFSAFLIGLLLWLGLHGMSGAIAQNAPITPDYQILKGLALYQNGNFVAAAQQLKQAANQAHQDKSPILEALALNYLTLAYQELGQDEAAQIVLNRGLTLVFPNAQASKRSVSQLLNTQGSLQFSQGKATAALESWQKAEKVYRQLNDLAGTAGSLDRKSVV